MALTDDLLDKAVLRAALTTQFENREVRDIVRFLDRQLFPEVESKLYQRLEHIRRAGGYDRGPWTTARLREMQSELRKVTGPHTTRMVKRLENGLAPFARSEVEWQASLLGDLLPVQLDLTMPTAQQLRSIIRSRPFTGEVMRGHMQQLDTRLRARAMQQIRIGLASGETTQQMLRRVRGAPGLVGVFGTTRHQAATIVRTAITHTSNLSRETLYRENEDVVKGVQWVATLDGATCPNCGGLDGQVYNVGQGERPPLHHQCRCTTVPVLKSWKELGVKLPELPEGTRAMLRADLNGMPAAKVTFEGWLGNQTKALQNMVLGRTRAEIWRAGKLPLRGFSNNRGQLLTLPELEQKIALLTKPKPKPRPISRPKRPAPAQPEKNELRDAIKVFERAHGLKPLYKKDLSHLDDMYAALVRGETALTDTQRIVLSRLQRDMPTFERFAAKKAAEKAAKQSGELLSKPTRYRKWEDALAKAREEMAEHGVDVKTLSRLLDETTKLPSGQIRAAQEKLYQQFLDALARANGKEAAKFVAKGGKATQFPAGSLGRHSVEGIEKFKREMLRLARDTGLRADMRLAELVEESYKSMLGLTERMHWSILDDTKLKTMKIFIKKGQHRAWAEEALNRIMMPDYVAIGRHKRLAGAMAHEWGHHLEFRNPYLKTRMVKYRSYRAQQTGGARGQLSKIYRNGDEMGYEDEFLKHYFGKVYRMDDATEMISMGLEHIVDQQGFWRMLNGDPEYLEMMWSVLRGY